MLLLHQSGTLKIGEVVRYTLTSTPAHDRILPAPSQLHLRIKNTTAIALRAAFIHGPYTLYASAAPSTFHPNEKFDNPRVYGVPEFEPQLKAGASFSTTLNVPENVRESAGTGYKGGGGEDEESVSDSEGEEEEEGEQEEHMEKVEEANVKFDSNHVKVSLNPTDSDRLMNFPFFPPFLPQFPSILFT